MPNSPAHLSYSPQTSADYFHSLLKIRLPLLFLLAAAISGILLEDFLELPSFFLLGSLILLSTFLTVSFCYTERFAFLKRAHPYLFFLFIFLAGCLYHAWQWKEDPARQLGDYLIAHPEENITFTGVVLQHLDPSPSPQNATSSPLKKQLGSRLLLQLEEIEIVHQHFFISAKVLLSWEGPTPQIGDRIRTRAEARPFSPPKNRGEFNYSERLARERIFTQLYVDPADPGKVLRKTQDDEYRSDTAMRCYSFLKNTLTRWAEKSSNYLAQLLTRDIENSGKPLTVIEGITLGKKPTKNSTEKADEQLAREFQETGTMHLFAISGLHVGMIAMMLWLLLNLLRLPKGIGVLLAIALIFFYVAITGMHVGSIRAAVMAAIILIGELSYHRSQPINSLAAASLFLLLSNTNLLFLPSWQLSFSVVLAILLLSPPIRLILVAKLAPDPFLPEELISSQQDKRRRFLTHLAESFSISAAAWIGSLIPSLYYFHQLSLSGLWVNVIAVPLAFLILATGLTSLLLGSIIPYLGVLCNNSNWLFANILLGVIHTSTLLPQGSLRAPHLSSSPFFPKTELLLLATPTPLLAMIQSESEHYLINTGSPATLHKTVFPLLELTGIKSLSGVILTEKKSRSLNGAPLLVESYPVKQLLVAPTQASSYVAKKIIAQLAKKENLREISPYQIEKLAPRLYGSFLPTPDPHQVAIMVTLDQEKILILPPLSPRDSLTTLKTALLYFPSLDILLLPAQNIPSKNALQRFSAFWEILRSFESKKKKSQQLQSIILTGPYNPYPLSIKTLQRELQKKLILPRLQLLEIKEGALKIDGKRRKISPYD